MCSFYDVRMRTQAVKTKDNEHYFDFTVFQDKVVKQVQLYYNIRLLENQNKRILISKF